MLVDSTIYIDWLRRGEDLAFVLKPYLISDQLFVCGMVRAEVLRGIRSIKLRDEISDLFDLMKEIRTDAQLWQKVATLAWTLDRRGIVLPMADLVIAGCALEANLSVVTTDPLFAQIPGLKVKKSLT
ncbi:MAG: PIN domain-containing protein [Verrucomicrobia bacterium]|nr:PIN domain-containing protein [Verrucomicrobiota bacterium]MBV8275055.1 PIN domain-containing protein [Verrucomicrobiota bacterium]